MTIHSYTHSAEYPLGVPPSAGGFPSDGSYLRATVAGYPGAFYLPANSFIWDGTSFVQSEKLTRIAEPLPVTDFDYNGIPLQVNDRFRFHDILSLEVVPPGFAVLDPLLSSVTPPPVDPSFGVSCACVFRSSCGLLLTGLVLTSP